MKQTDAAYIAAMVDGEGTIGIFLSRSPSRPNYAVLARMRVAVCNEPLIRSLQRDASSGTVTSWQQAKQWKRIWAVTWNGYAAAELIHKIRPFLRLKRPQADLLVAWTKISKRWQGKLGGRGHRERKYPDHVWRRAEAMGAKMRNLNA